MSRGRTRRRWCRGRAGAARWRPRARAGRRPTTAASAPRRPGGWRRGRRWSGRRTRPRVGTGIGGTNGDDPVASTHGVVGDRPGRRRRGDDVLAVEGATGSPRTSSTACRRARRRRASAPRGRGAVEQRREVDPVVGPTRLLADHDQARSRTRPRSDGGLDEAVADHAVADDEDRPAPIRLDSARRALAEHALQRADGRRYTIHVTTAHST